MLLRASTFLAYLALAAPATAQVVRISVSPAGAEGNGPSTAPAISGDGRFVAFASAATNLVAGDTNGLPDIFLRDRDTDADGVFDEPGAAATTRLNLGPGGVQANGVSSAPAITPDGRFVCFVSKATNLVPGNIAEVLQVFRLDRATGTLITISVNDAGVPGDLHSGEPAMSADGDIVAFSSEASSLVGGAATTTSGVFVREVTAGRTTRLSPPGPASTNAYYHPSVSADGRFILYQSSAIVRPLNLYSALLVDRAAGTTRALDAEHPVFGQLSASGTHALLWSFGELLRLPVDLPGQQSPRLSAPSPFLLFPSPDLAYVVSPSTFFDYALQRVDPLPFVVSSAAFGGANRWMAIESPTASLVPAGGDTNGVADVFVVDLPDFFDADDDGMDDRWEATFQVTDASGDPDADGLTNLQEFQAGSHPNGVARRYLAEGATGTFFQTAIALANPDPAQPAAAVLTFDKGDGTRVRQTLTVPALRSAVVHVAALPGLAAADMSTTVESDRPLGVERTMTWDTRAPSAPERGYGSHRETATTAPSTTWFLAEGSTVLEFNLFYLLHNPQATTTHATVRFLRPSGSVITRAYDLPPRSRTTIEVNAVPGLEETDVSGDVAADAPIVVERSMYRNLPGQPFGLGHASMGVTAPATRWFLAEGATGAFFDLFVLIANPSGADALVEAQYAKPDGSVVTRQYTVRANSRFSVYVDAIAGLDSTSVATTVVSTNAVPIVVERAMYWPGGFFDYYEGHSSAASTVVARRWVVAGAEFGYQDTGQTFVLIANTQDQAGSATVTVLPTGSNGPPAPLIVALPPNSRTTVPVVPAPGTFEFGVLVESTGASPVDIVVESSVYRTVDGVLWSAGSNALATPLP
jgi:hypothetical protein